MRGKYLIYGALALVGMSFLGAKKAFDINEVVPQLQAALSGIRKLGANGTGLTITIDVLIKNPTNKALNLAALGAVKVAKLHLHDRNGNYVGRAEPNLTTISIPSNGQIILKNLVLHGEYTDLLQFIIGGGFSLNVNDYTVTPEIEALGRTITV